MQLNFNLKNSSKEKNTEVNSLPNQNSNIESNNPTNENTNATTKNSSNKEKKENPMVTYKKQVALKKAIAKQERMKQKNKLNIHTQEQFESNQLKPLRNWSFLFLLASLFFGIKSFMATYILAGIINIIQVICFVLTIITCGRKIDFFDKDYLIFFLVGILLTPIWVLFAII